MNTSSEKELVSRAASGDNDAFSQLVTLYEKRLYGFSLGMLSNPDDAFDAVQETFLKAYRSLPFFKGESSFYTWIYTICRNCCYDIIKANTRRAHRTRSLFEYENDDDGSIIEIPDTSYDPHRTMEKRDVHNTIISAIDAMAPHHREIIILRDINGMSYEEISRVMNISEGTVKSRLARARIRLAKNLKDKL